MVKRTILFILRQLLRFHERRIKNVYFFNKRKIYNTTLGPYSPNPLILLELKILLTREASEEIQSYFLFDSGACSNYLTMDTFTKLCKASNFSQEWEFKKNTAVIANGETIEFDCLERILFVKLEDNHIFHIPFIINKRFIEILSV